MSQLYNYHFSLVFSNQKITIMAVVQGLPLSFVILVVPEPLLHSTFSLKTTEFFSFDGSSSGLYTNKSCYPCSDTRYLRDEKKTKRGRNLTLLHHKQARVHTDRNKSQSVSKNLILSIHSKIILFLIYVNLWCVRICFLVLTCPSD